MEDKNTEWLTKEEEGSQDFEFELFLSSDGKNTVRVLAHKPEARREAMAYAKKVFDRLIALYGTKAEQALKAAEASGVKCETCGQPAEEKSGISKTGKPYHGVFCLTNKTHVKWGKAV